METKVQVSKEVEERRRKATQATWLKVSGLCEKYANDPSVPKEYREYRAKDAVTFKKMAERLDGNAI